MLYDPLCHCTMLSQEMGLLQSELSGFLLWDLYNAIKNDKKQKCKRILKYNISIVNMKDFIYRSEKKIFRIV